MIDIISVNAENFLSYESFHLDMRSLDGYDFPCFVVTGKNLDDVSSTYKDGKYTGSNGSGKTSLFESVCWCLFGKIPRGNVYKDDVVNIWKGDKCRVTVELSVGGKSYAITRIKKINSSEKVIIIEGTEEITQAKVRNSNEKIEEILNMDFDNFCMTGFLFETNYSQFGSSTDKEKKENLKGLIPEHIQKIRDYVGEDKSGLDSLLGKLDKLKISVDSKVSLLSSQIDKKKETANSLRGKIKKMEREENIDFFRSEMENNKTLLVDLEKFSEEYKNKIDKIENNISNGGDRLREKQNALKDIESARKDKERALLSEKRKLENLGELDSKTVCPTCNRKYEKEKEERIRENYFKIRDQILSNIESIEEGLKEETGDGGIAEEIEVYRKAINKLKLDRDELIKKLSDNKRNVGEIERTIAEYKSKIESSDTHQDTMLLATLENQIVELEDEIEKHKRELQSINSSIEKTRETLKYVDFWYSQAGWNGIISYYMDEIIKSIEDKANEILNEVSDDVLVSISSYKVNKKGDANNNIEISIISNDKRKPYAMASSGERKKIDLAITLSIRDIYNSRRGSSLNMMVLDEVFKGLDTASSVSLMRYLPMRYKNLNIFLISHDSSVNNYILPGHEVEVVKKSGISSVSCWPNGKERA